MARTFFKECVVKTMHAATQVVCHCKMAQLPQWPCMILNAVMALLEACFM